MKICPECQERKLHFKLLKSNTLILKCHNCNLEFKPLTSEQDIYDRQLKQAIQLSDQDI